MLLLLQVVCSEAEDRQLILFMFDSQRDFCMCIQVYSALCFFFLFVASAKKHRHKTIICTPDTQMREEWSTLRLKYINYLNNLGKPFVCEN